MTVKVGASSFLAITCSVVSVLLVAGCSGQEGGAADSQGAPNSGSVDQVEVKSPKDAGAVDPCSLLPAPGAESLGMDPQGQKGSGSFGDDQQNSCDWDTSDGSINTSLSVFSDRTLKDYDRPEAYVDFEKTIISGHPAVRANQGDPKVDGTCVIFLASNPGQVVQATGQVPSTKRGEADPCDLAKKTLESAVPSWPAAK